MNQLRIRKLAAQDIQDAVDYYDEVAPHITDRFLEALKRGFEEITVNPLSYAYRFKNTRIHFVHHFPFGIHYLYAGKTIHVLAVLHTSRNPRTGMSRG